MFPKCTRPRPIVSPVKIALKSPKPDAAKAEAYFERALAVAWAQQAKSWELRRFDLGFRISRSAARNACPALTVADATHSQTKRFDGMKPLAWPGEPQVKSAGENIQAEGVK